MFGLDEFIEKSKAEGNERYMRDKQDLQAILNILDDYVDGTVSWRDCVQDIIDEGLFSTFCTYNYLFERLFVLKIKNCVSSGGILL